MWTSPFQTVWAYNDLVETTLNNLAAGQYRFRFEDLSQDGVCCGYGENGNAKVLDADNGFTVLMNFDGKFPSPPLDPVDYVDTFFTLP